MRGPVVLSLTIAVLLSVGCSYLRLALRPELLKISVFLQVVCLERLELLAVRAVY